MDASSKKRKTEENGTNNTTIAPSTSKITPEDSRKILEPFTQDQLLDILQSAAVRHTDVLDSVRSIADPDIAKRKLFVRGLGWDTTADALRNTFSVYGELEEAVVILDKATGKSKGFGFVTFKHVDGAFLALKEPSKKIDGRITGTNLAAKGNPGKVGNFANPGAAAAAPGVDGAGRKIYVANVPVDMPSERLLAHFAAYGEIQEGPLGLDKETGKFRGYAMFVYKTVEAARAALVDPTKLIDGVQLFCKIAYDGKKGKPVGVVPNVENAGDVAGVGVGVGAAGVGLQQPPSSMPGSVASQFGAPGGVGVPPYGGFSGVHQGPPPGMVGAPHGMPHQYIPSTFQSSIGAPGLSSVPTSFGAGGGYGGSSVPSSFGAGGGYGGSYVGLGGGPTPGGGYGGLGNAGLGSAGSSLYRMPPSSAGLPSGGGYPDTKHYSLSSSSFPHHPTGYPGMPHY